MPALTLSCFRAAKASFACGVTDSGVEPRLTSRGDVVTESRSAHPANSTAQQNTYKHGNLADPHAAAMLKTETHSASAALTFASAAASAAAAAAWRAFLAAALVDASTAGLLVGFDASTFLLTVANRVELAVFGRLDVG